MSTRRSPAATHVQDDLFGADVTVPTPPAKADDQGAAREKLVLVHQRLCREYGCPVGYFHELTPLDELVSSLLSHRTRNSESGAAYKELRKRFPNWVAVRDAPVGEVQEAISACNWPEQKAPRIQQILRLITQRRGGELSLDFLEPMPVREGRDWLETLPGVGPKTSAAVYIFSRIRGRALPVDSHHHRVAQRLGLIPMSLDVGPAQLHVVVRADADRGHVVLRTHDMLQGQTKLFREAAMGDEDEADHDGLRPPAPDGPRPTARPSSAVPDVQR